MIARRKLTRAEDKALWVATRLVPHSNRYVTLARRTRLEVEYEALALPAWKRDTPRYATSRVHVVQQFDNARSGGR